MGGPGGRGKGRGGGRGGGRRKNGGKFKQAERGQQDGGEVN